MASYQNTCEYYCGLNMDSYPEQYTDPNVNQSACNYQTHRVGNFPESYIYNNGFHKNAPQDNIMQYTPVTPAPVPYSALHLQPRPYYNNQNMSKRHRAQITILPVSPGNFKTIVKRKRKRTFFSTEQVQALEDIFKTKKYISRVERQIIVNQLHLNDKSVKTWFQNRRLKHKREIHQGFEGQDETDSIESSRSTTSIVDRLDSLESHIRGNTDEHGFVTLDDGVMGDLFNVIDDCLSKNRDDVSVENITESDSSPVYEPISPASTCDTASNEEGSSIFWKPTEPSESLQILFDLQNMLSF